MPQIDLKYAWMKHPNNWWQRLDHLYQSEKDIANGLIRNTVVAG
jgi:hypothetical protein